MSDDRRRSSCSAECSRDVSALSNSRASTHLDLVFTPERDTPFSPMANSRPPSRMSFVAQREVANRAGEIPEQRRRRRTTTDVDFGGILTLPRISPTRSISPTRNNNPQPVGLVLQSPYNRTGEV